jgi:hypothetical protein
VAAGDLVVVVVGGTVAHTTVERTKTTQPVRIVPWDGSPSQRSTNKLAPINLKFAMDRRATEKKNHSSDS